MRSPFLRINALTRADRHHVIALLRDAVLDSGGWITDFKLFSNASICINFELPTRHVGRLRDALKALPLSLSEESERAFDDFLRPSGQRGAQSADAEIVGTLQVTFIHNEPDLRIEVPPIPG